MPLLRKKMTGLKPASGFLATEVLVPDFSKLSWEVIAEIRKQKSVLLNVIMGYYTNRHFVQCSCT